MKRKRDIKTVLVHKIKATAYSRHIERGFGHEKVGPLYDKIIEGTAEEIGRQMIIFYHEMLGKHPPQTDFWLEIGYEVLESRTEVVPEEEE